jgi:hypothetical protein
MTDFWSLKVTATLDRAPSDADAAEIARRVAGDNLLGHTLGNPFDVVASTENPDVLSALAEHYQRFTDAVSAHGYTVLAWESIESLSDAETRRRIKAAAPPQLINAAEFAALLGVTHQRVYDLASAKKQAHEEGKLHPFPHQYVPGWWLKHAAEGYAENRRGPGRPRKNPLKD